MKKVAIIILNWNGKEDTLACLESLRGLIYENREIILADNGSTDDSLDAIRASYPEVTVVENGENLGFAEGNNRGIRVALDRGADYVMLLNNDTTVAADMIDRLVKGAARHEDSDIFGAKIFYHDEPERIWFGGAYWNAAHVGFDIVGADKTDAERFCREAETDYACGCALFASARAWNEVGLLDPDFFVMWEETDWCARARTAGMICRMIPSAHVYHKISRSFKDGKAGAVYAYYNWRNRLLWMERHVGRGKILGGQEGRVLVAKLVKRLTLAATPLRTKQSIASRAAIQGVRDYVRRRFGKGPAWLTARK